MNKILVNIYFPKIDKSYDVLLPPNQKIETIILQLLKGLNELNDNNYDTNNISILYNKFTGDYYELNSIVTNITSGSKLILI